MIKSYLTIALRSFYREKYYTIIKIGGLALGLGTSLVLFLYISFQLSFDSFHSDKARIFRINQTNIWDPNGGIFGSTAPPLGLALTEDFPEVEEVVRINTPGEQLVVYEENGQIISFHEKSILASDSTFFSFFNVPLIEGDPGTALVGKNKVVLSEEAARKYFGQSSALGKILLVGANRIPVAVSGVAKFPPNMHFRADLLVSIYTNPAIKNFEWSWVWTQVVTYVKLRNASNVDNFSAKLSTIAPTYIPASLKMIGMDYDEFIRTKGEWNFYAQPLEDIHLYSAQIGNRLGPVGDIKDIYIFGSIGVFILLLAIINFVNLSTARATKRAKEVGLKKTIGVNKRTLIMQFQAEHILMTCVAMIIGIAVMEVLRLVLLPLIGVEIELMTVPLKSFLLLTIGLTLLTGFLSGLYPSLYLTSFQPASILKGKFISGMQSRPLRNFLVVCQFTISIALMTCTFIVHQQVNYLSKSNIGFDTDNLLIVNHAEHLDKQLESFGHEVEKLPGIAGASLAMDIRKSYEDIFMREGDGLKLPITLLKVDENFIPLLGLKMVAGRAFGTDQVSDYRKVIINETTARLFGWSPQEALDQKIIYVGDEVGPQEIIGVVNDFHFQSLRQTITPLIFYHVESSMWGDERVLVVKVNPEQIASTVKQVESIWKKVSPAAPFSYSFYREELEMQYDEERRLGSLFYIFTGISIAIAIVGLMGLVAYSAEQRKKEIGIRKTFGATLANIYWMVNTQYIRLLFISFVISVPCTWWLMQQWLNTFAYKIEINPLVFAVAAGIQIFLSLLCVSYSALQAASHNPAVVLKTE